MDDVVSFDTKYFFFSLKWVFDKEFDWISYLKIWIFKNSKFKMYV